MPASKSKLAPHPDLTDYYARAEERPKFVRDIFDTCAPWYEWMIAAPSFGSGTWYRADALKRHGWREGMRLLDLATGTGVVGRAALDVTAGRGRVVGVDPSIGMLLEAREGPLRSRLVQATGTSLPFASGSFDMISVGFAMRHFGDLNAAFVEMRRVLAPGGTLLVMEITPPRSRVARTVLGAYMGSVVPLLTRLRTGSAEAAKLMRYYWDTTKHCVPPETILGALHEAGFPAPRRDVQLGIFSEYTAKA
ncbi:MAG: class I SAM-dependent methyltransferase [Thermoanaerobaculia bacterium]|jgi:demethylmenaquinone methyltransferase/2-methoxy-6-polyprenyl-1,4-benzoquinol methylase